MKRWREANYRNATPTGRSEPKFFRLWLAGRYPRTGRAADAGLAEVTLLLETPDEGRPRADTDKPIWEFAAELVRDLPRRCRTMKLSHRAVARSAGAFS
ncbi:MAG: hypothetical protein RKR03_11810 [Candidatus Competibacter sp.]|nr:hypothetical protein [Candidatus Competibacter sp.]